MSEGEDLGKMRRICAGHKKEIPIALGLAAFLSRKLYFQGPKIVLVLTERNIGTHQNNELIHHPVDSKRGIQSNVNNYWKHTTLACLKQ